MTKANLIKWKAHYEKTGNTEALEDLLSKYPELATAEKEE